MLTGLYMCQVVSSFASICAEEKAFRDEVAAMPEDQREAAIKRRRDWQQELRRLREHEQMVEALKPHNFWSFLGLGRK